MTFRPAQQQAVHDKAMHIWIVRIEIALKQQAGFSLRPEESQTVKIAKAANHVALHGGGINAQSQQQQIQSGVEQLSAGGGVDHLRRLSQTATQLLRIAKPCASRARMRIKRVYPIAASLFLRQRL